MIWFKLPERLCLLFRSLGVKWRAWLSGDDADGDCVMADGLWNSGAEWLLGGDLMN